MQRHLVRALMWAVIIAGVWLAARCSGITPGQDRKQEAMLDAARHYQEYKGRLQEDAAPAQAIEDPSGGKTQHNVAE